MADKKEIKDTINNIVNKVSTTGIADRPLVDWRPILAKECQVYVFNETYLAKRFDQINYKFCSRDIAKEILIDNLYALLRYKYFTNITDEIDEKINDIIKVFTSNLKTSLIRVSFNEDSECEIVKWLPNGCIAFRNGVYDFRKNEWLFKYDKVRIEKLKNTIYMYDPIYIITWYVNIDFEPLPLDITTISLDEFIDIMKELDKDEKNYCFELLYNMSHNFNDKYDSLRFTHLCEILGYLCYQSFAQKFVMLVGSGQNGKNSLFDGCFSDRIIPKPASTDLQTIENDRFVTGTLENKAHNIYLETSTNETVYKDNTRLKALTGSMDQQVESKGIQAYSSIINCKYLWSANDQDKIKFSDNTTGFRRRINIFEIWYRWDNKKRFLKKGDYYDTTFSEDLHELKGNINNVIIFIYFAMYGILTATKNFTESFNFTENEWKMRYTDVDFDLKDAVENITPEKIQKWLKYPSHYEDGKSMFYDMLKRRLFESDTMKEIGYMTYDDFINRFLDNDEDFVGYFVDHDVYMSIRHIQQLCGNIDTSMTFTSNFKKTFGVTSTLNLTNNKPYVRVTFVNKKLKILV